MRPQTATIAKLTDADLDGMRELIEQRSAILFDSSRERFFSIRVRECMEEQGADSGTEFLQRIRQSSAEYDAFLERLLTQETSFFRYPAFFEALEKRILPEVQKRRRGVEGAPCASGAQAAQPGKNPIRSLSVFRKR